MYLNKFSPLTQDPAQLDCAGANSAQFVCFQDVMVDELLALTSTAMNSTGSIVLTFVLRPTYGSTTGEVSLGTLTIGSASAVGDVYYKRIAPTKIKAGQVVAVKVTTAATTSGKVIPGFQANESPEMAANDSKFIAG